MAQLGEEWNMLSDNDKRRMMHMHSMESDMMPPVGPVSPVRMMPPALPILSEQAKTMGATPTGITSVAPQKTVTQNPLVDPRMARSYQENIKLMGDPRMRGAKGGLAKILGV